MESFNLMEDLKFHRKNPNAEPLHVDAQGRVLRFTLGPGQSIREHLVPSSPFYVVILEGQGVFTGKDGKEQSFGPNTLLIFDPGERHTVRALDNLVFIGFLHGAPGAQVDESASTVKRRASAA